MALALLALAGAVPAVAQRDLELDAKGKLFPEVTAGVAAIKSRVVQAPGAGAGTAAGTSGADAAAAPTEERLYYLLIPALRNAATGTAAAAILVYRNDGTRVAQMPAPAASATTGVASSGGASAADLAAVQPKEALVLYGQDFDVDTAGRIFIADRAANAVKIFAADGTPAGSISVPAPTSVAALGGGEVAVTSLRAKKLVTVYAEQQDAVTGRMVWRAVREFGEAISDLADPAQSGELNRFLNLGQLATDPEGSIYYAFSYVPEPTVRKYDRFGFKQYETQLATLDFQPSAQAARRNLDRLSQSRFAIGAFNAPPLPRTVTALAADPVSHELWVALGATLLHFDAEGIRRHTYRLFTKEGVRVEASAIVVEDERLIIASDALGVFEFPRPAPPRQ